MNLGLVDKIKTEQKLSLIKKEMEQGVINKVVVDNFNSSLIPIAKNYFDHKRYIVTATKVYILNASKNKKVNSKYNITIERKIENE